MKSIGVLLVGILFLVQPSIVKAQNDRVLSSGNFNYTEDDEAAEYYEKGNYYFEKGKFTLAAKYYRMSIDEDSLFVEAYDNLGLTYRQMNELDSAAKYYAISIELYPEGGLALQNLGVVYEKKKNYEKAVEVYSSLIELSNSNPEGYYGRARMYMFLEDYDNAMQDALMAEELYNTYESEYVMDAHYLIGLIYYFMEDMENSRKYLKLAKEEGVNVSQTLQDAVGMDTNPE
jgi:tetratricopeptide (TPR) repeat protein